MKLNLNLGETDQIEIDITDTAIEWNQSTRMSVAWPTKIAGEISKLFPKYRLTKFNCTVDNVDSAIMNISVSWGCKQES